MRSPCGSNAMWGFLISLRKYVARPSYTQEGCFCRGRWGDDVLYGRTDVFAHWLFVVCLPEQQNLSCLFPKQNRHRLRNSYY